MALERSILHMDLDTFFVSCERLLDSRLNGKPILIGGTTDRGVVASCSYEARLSGIKSGMPMKLAKGLCPEAIVIKGNSAIYSKYSKLVAEIIAESVPLYEYASIDEFYIDLSGMDKFFGCLQYSGELRSKITRETGLPLSFGLSTNKTVSKIATGVAKPNNQLQVVKGSEKDFLCPLSIRKIPMVGDKTYQKLRKLGIKIIHHIQEMDGDLIHAALGENGITIWKKANGIDNSPVRQYHDRLSISTERTFDRDTIDIQKVRSICIAIAENLAYQLRIGQKLTGCVTVHIRYSDFENKTIQQRVAFTAADHELIPVVTELFNRCYDRRMMIRLIGVRFSELVNGLHQMTLFGDNERDFALYKAMDKIRQRYGDRAVIRAVGMEARTIGRENPFLGFTPPPLLANRRQ